MTYDAILPAGGHIDPAFAQRVGTSSKALIRFRGDSIIGKTIHSLRETGMISRIVVVGGQEVRQAVAGDVDEVIDEGTSGPDSIFRGLKHLLERPNPPEKVVVVTADLPYLTPNILRRFLEMCPKGVDICVPIVRERDFKRRFPNTTSTYVPLADDRWTMGGAYLVDVKALQRAMPQLEKVFANRKSVFGMARLLGPKFLWLFVTKRLTVPDIEAKIRAMLGCSGAAVMDVPPELAYDVDALDDYEWMMEHQA